MQTSQALNAFMLTQQQGPDLRERELQQCQRELRKERERNNLLQSQVITLQQQVTSMGPPLMSSQAAAQLPGELDRLRLELAEARAQRERAGREVQELMLHLELQQQKALTLPEGCLDAMSAAGLRKKLQDREYELTHVQQRLSSQDAELITLRRELAYLQQLQQQQQQQQQRPARASSPWRGNQDQVLPLRQCSTGSSAGLRAGRGDALGGSLSHVPPLLPPRPGTPDVASASRGPGGLLGGSVASLQGLPASLYAEASDPFAYPGGTRRAVIVGCDYAGRVGALRAGVADAQQWARFFSKRCSFAEQDIRLLTDDQQLYQQAARPESAVATRDNILRALQWLTAQSMHGDQMFFVFCGHGCQLAAEEYAGKLLCETVAAPADVCDGQDPMQPRVVSDTDVHRALLQACEGSQATLIYDSCHAGRPLDRAGLNYLSGHVSRGRVDYEKLKGHPVLPRFLELSQWRKRPTPPESAPESSLRCRAVQWSACANAQFCVELPIDDRPRGVFTYIFISALLKVGTQAPSNALLREAQQLTADLKGRWRLQQDVQFNCSRCTSDMQQFLV